MDRYVIHHKIGSGNYAKVYLATDVCTQEEVALKLVNKRELKGAKAINRVRSEIANMKKLCGHKNVVSLYHSFETSRQFGLAMEYVPGGELFEYVQNQAGMKESNGREMFKEILEGVKHCHKHGVAHRDLKLENILLGKGNQPKIADFGFSNYISPQPIYSSSVGSLLYSSPEIIQGKPYQGPECDVWSLGVILYTMLTATMPFDDSNMGDFIAKIENGEYPAPMGVSDAAKDLISKMLNPNAETRYTLDEVLAHPWLAEPSVATSGKTRRRRFGVSYKSPDTVRHVLLKHNECNCSCHREDYSKQQQHGRDSVITRHCDDCADVQANDPEVMLRRQVLMSRDSSVSSGYGSEVGSQYLGTPSPLGDSAHLLGFELLAAEGGRRCSLPRKSSASSSSTLQNKSICYQHRCSMPSSPNILRQGERQGVAEDDDIVFV